MIETVVLMLGGQVGYEGVFEGRKEATQDRQAGFIWGGGETGGMGLARR